MSRKRNCLILGSGRSGTSMLGGCLHGAGYYMGTQLHPPTGENPKGYFESPDIERINEAILGYSMFGRGAPLVDRLFRRKLQRGHYWLAELPLSRRVREPEGIAALIDAQAAHRPYAFKDPRFSYTLPIWRPRLTDVVFVVVFREPGRTVQSILANCRNSAYLRDFKISADKAFRIWTLLYLHILRHLEDDGEWIFLHYDQILDGSGLRTLSNMLGEPLAAGFPDAGLKRSPDMAAIPPAVQSLYERLCALAGFAAAEGQNTP